jgi:hypothetical protein
VIAPAADVPESPPAEAAAHDRADEPLRDVVRADRAHFDRDDDDDDRDED